MGCKCNTEKIYIDRAKVKYQAQDRPVTQKVRLYKNAIEDCSLPPFIPGSN